MFLGFTYSAGKAGRFTYMLKQLGGEGIPSTPWIASATAAPNLFQAIAFVPVALESMPITRSLFIRAGIKEVRLTR
jgi:hypothetical protein